jgi:ABC-2 type transport system ATP-binding protein
MTKNYLELRNVRKNFSDFTLDDISFSLPKGYIMGLIGPNGAGKTTTIKLILNMLEKDNGIITVFGLDSVKQEHQFKQNVGVVFDNNPYVDEWTIAETEKAISPFYDTWGHHIFSETLERFQLSPKTKVGNLSRGMQMKLMLSIAFSHDAKMLILDEPTSGLDPLTRDELLEMLQEYIKDGNKSVLFSTHITADLQRVADYITLLANGKLIFTGSMDELLQKYRVIKGAPNELTPELNECIIGLRKTDIGFEGLIDASTMQLYKGYISDIPTIDEIVIYIGRGGHLA